jgi:hypothetical protein
MAEKKYIELQKALNVCEMHYQHCLEMHDWSGDTTADNIMRDIETIPTVDVVEVKHAHWREGRFLKVGDSVKGYPSVICSDCGITFCDIINNHNYMYRYCPNCGAKMDGGKTE